MRRLSLAFTLLLVAACDCGSDPSNPETCTTADDCPSGQLCISERCTPRPQGDGGAEDAGLCEGGEPRCGGLCCSEGQLCDGTRCVLDCGPRPVCGSLCCAEGQMCSSENTCVAACADETQLCGPSSEFCCDASSEACLGDACVGLGDPCMVTDECEADEICLPSLGRCAPRSSVEVCEFRPPVGTFSPRTACQWRPEAGDVERSDDVVMTPSVANLSDDNGDGQTDTLDIPDLVFISFDYQRDSCCTARGTLRVVSGACNEDGTMDTLATIPAPFVGNSSGIALGNLHPAAMADERTPEIVATFKNGGTIAWRRTADDGSAWEELWRNAAALPRDRSQGGAQPSIADLNGDGAPEVIIGNIALNGLTGEVFWDGATTEGPTDGNQRGVGHNAFLGPTSTVADLDLDGSPEVIAGNTVYEGATGNEVWTYEYVGHQSGCQGRRCDGFNAVGNFDADPEGEVVIVRRGEVFVLNHDGSELHRVTIPRDDCSNNESGPPTVADFDGDGNPEIGTAGADFYVVIDFDCTGDPLPAGCASENVLWTVPNQDCSSRATGSSVFDFEGDGAAEVVYADETSFRIFDGRNGTVLYEDNTHQSNTRMEMPIVVDVNNDGKSEVIVPEPNRTSTELGGIEVWADADNNWVRTRRIWNQHTYHVTNISEDGQVPAVEEPNWSDSRLNNFRQNVQPGGIFDAADLVVRSIEVDECNGADENVTIAVTVANEGALGAAPGVPVLLRVTPDGGTAEVVGVQRTTTLLLPGQQERVLFVWDPDGGFTTLTFDAEAEVDTDLEGAGVYNECHEDNNLGQNAEVLMTCTFG